ncbi:MAG: DUF4405 domain-containing protein [Desulfobulbaceae bacterium]|nr:MAG: DUF4405 domain-containing protein [Desulfobulbaceae bacterium]
MSLRKITSMTLIWSLIALIFNSVILYIVPEGRVANWAVWKFWGLDKHDWSAQHITVGVLFCVAGIFHIYLNWKPIMSYLKNKKQKSFNLFTSSSIIGFVLTVVFIVGTYFNVPPMSTIVELSEQIKDSAGEKYGNPPYGQAQSSSIKSFTARLGLDLSQAKKLLADNNIQVNDDQETVQSISARAKVTPQQLLDIIKPARQTSEKSELTSSNDEHSEEIIVDATKAPKSGMGKKTITQLCDELQADCQMIIEALGKKGMDIQPDMKLKDLANQNDTGPMQIYEMIEEIIVKSN